MAESCLLYDDRLSEEALRCPAHVAPAAERVVSPARRGTAVGGGCTGSVCGAVT